MTMRPNPPPLASPRAQPAPVAQSTAPQGQSSSTFCLIGSDDFLSPRQPAAVSLSLAPPPQVTEAVTRLTNPLTTRKPPRLDDIHDISATDLDTLDWADITDVHPSRKGQFGVTFLEVSELHLLAVKTAPNIRREHLAQQLAAAVGLRTASPSRLLETPCLELREATDFRPEAVVLVMPRLRGVSFAELTPAQEQELIDGTDAGRRIFCEMGAVYAFDCFIGNEDRFAGLGGQNRGNLMWTAQGLTLIDSTIGPATKMTKPAYRQKHAEMLRKVLAQRQVIDSAAAEACFAGEERFLPKELGISWKHMAKPFVSGFRQGVEKIAALPNTALERLMVPAMLDPPTQDFLRTNLAAFKAVAAASEATSEGPQPMIRRAANDLRG